MTSQILNYKEGRLQNLAHQIIRDGYAILHDQELSQQELVEVSNRFGHCESYGYFMNPKDNPEISIVSDQKDENGKAIGMFGDTELQWHANGSARHLFNEICVSLYCVVECVDTVLSICNQCDAFAELSERDKERYQSHQKGFYPSENEYSKKSKVTSYKKKIYSAPTTINLEMTEACNVKCRHCYNPWREEHAGKFNLDKNKIDYLIDEFVKNKIFHVILSGGEPLAKFNELCYALEKLVANNISTSLNSNLMLATPEKMKKLKDLGLDHVLTSWFSYFPTETDNITKSKGSYQKIVEGIKTTVAAGIRVSANTIVT